MTGLKRLLKWKAACGSSPAYEEEATGNPATFTTNLKKNLTGLVIPFTPSQSGSGDPSPTNVRPFIGLTGITIYLSGEDTSDQETYSVTWTSAGNVYSGELNAITGVLTADKGHALLNDPDKWTEESSVDFVYTQEISRKVTGTSYAGLSCSCALAEYDESKFYCRWRSSDENLFRMVDGTGTYSLADIKAMAEAGSIEICYEIEPVTVATLTAVEIETLIGENNLWTNTNGSNTVKYLKK